MLKKLRMSARSWVTNHKKTFSRDMKLKKITMCKKCRTFYYKHLWHFEGPKGLALDEEAVVPVRFTECPACLEQDAAFFEQESQLA